MFSIFDQSLSVDIQLPNFMFYVLYYIISVYKVNNGWGTPHADHKSPLNWLDDLSPLSAEK